MRWIILLVIGVTALVALSSCSSPGIYADRNHYIETKDTNAIDFFMMRWFGADDWADQQAEIAANPDLVPMTEISFARILTPSAQPQLTWLGHASFLLQYKSLNVLTDPILSERASPVSFAGPERLTPAPLTAAELPPIDYVVISHNHYDHLDEETILALGDDVVYLVPLGLTEWFVAHGIEASRVREFDWWQQASIGPLEITSTPSQHWSARSLWDKNDTLWTTWHIAIADWQVWFAGDTGYNAHQFKEIGERFPAIDLGLIPIGAYQPRWFMKPQHVNPAEALQMHLDIGARHSYAMHWGTYQLAAEGLAETHQDFTDALASAELENPGFTRIKIGETLVMDKEPAN
ncbi:MBL fold metallo-hydrolase [Pseudidiomarina sp. 1APP75-32.1]|uniref:MBL fold metallo-hydrolase n=1 Tax=Pseudidiomarina terrestris TaxID=2820060 RepID=A0AAW7R047_9GAMM|nr:MULTISPECIES: MBL fold metallo-hydrolase [unclassified Pseudidiomarina]MDN7124643.1 MBL fold metallo-hydrolase [Pseudidiomarina sp. 1APP75-32.1]MDN7129066.1 MBL fold metallo-hydrolase [Pseudidiomarina sp. 1APR75-15]